MFKFNPLTGSLDLVGGVDASLRTDLNSLISLTGMPANSTTLGTFTGSTIADNVTIKAALQALETAVEDKDANNLTGTTLAATVVNSSLTALGTVVTGTWNATTIDIAHGGTGQVTANAAFAALSPMTTDGDLITRIAGVPDRIAANPTAALLFLASSNNVVSYQPIPTQGVLTYYLQGIASDLGGAYKQITTPAPTATLTTNAVPTGTTLLQTFITDPGNPNRTFIPSGEYSSHIHAEKVIGTKQYQLRTEIWEANAAGADIALIASLGPTYNLTGATTEYVIATSRGLYTLVGTTSRIKTKVYAIGASGGSAANISIEMSSAYDSNTRLPAPVVDASNFVPYIGATSTLNLGSQALSAASANIPKLSNLITNGFVKTSGLDGTLSVDTTTYLNTTLKGANNGLAELDGGGKVPVTQLPNSIMEFQGNWNATTNSPTLIDGTGNIGDVYRVNIAGTQDLGSGSQTFVVGDWVVYGAGAIWEKSHAGADAVVSVNSAAGVVTVNAINQLTSDVTTSAASGSQSLTATIANNAVTNAKAAQMAAHTFKGNNTAALANASDLTATELTAELNVMTGDLGAGGLKGLVPAQAAGDAVAGKVLKADGVWTKVYNSGDIIYGSATFNDNTPNVNITGLALDLSTVNSFEILINVNRTTAGLANTETIKILGVQNTASPLFSFSQENVGVSTGITISITDLGLVQYTSTSTGFGGTMKYRLTTV